jgi:hypothetical protein
MKMVPETHARVDGKMKERQTLPHSNGFRQIAPTARNDGVTAIPTASMFYKGNNLDLV